jgi:hypothetical protein
MRYFIFFYKCQSQSGSMYGQYGNWSKTLPSNTFVAKEVAKSSGFKAGQVNILSFNEVTADDYNSFFDK